MNVRINKKQRNLMISSQLTEEYPWLYDLLRQKEKLDIEDVPNEHHTDFQYVAPYILKQCGEEWKGNDGVLHLVEDLGENRRPCGLCGTPNRYIYYIQNRLNGKTLNVGSDCVEEFTDFDFLREGKSKGQLLRKAKEIGRRATINKKFPGIEIKIEEWLSRLSRYKILIPASLEKEYLIAYYRLRELYKLYLEEKKEDNVFEEISQLLSDEDRHVTDFENYQKRNANLPYIATNRMVNWLKERKDQQTIEFLKEDGKVTTRTISRIWEVSFITGILSDISNLFSSIGLQIEMLDNENDGFVLFTNIPSIKLLCKYEKFVYYFGSSLFGEKPFATLDLKNIVKISEIYERSSYEGLIDEFKDKTRRWKAGISIRDDYYSNNEILLVDRQTNLILPFSLNGFIQEFKGVVFGLPKPTRNSFEEFVRNTPGRRYTRRELDDVRKVAGEMNRSPSK